MNEELKKLEKQRDELNKKIDYLREYDLFKMHQRLLYSAQKERDSYYKQRAGLYKAYDKVTEENIGTIKDAEIDRHNYKEYTVKAERQESLIKMYEESLNNSKLKLEKICNQAQ